MNLLLYLLLKICVPFKEYTIFNNLKTIQWRYNYYLFINSQTIVIVLKNVKYPSQVISGDVTCFRQKCTYPFFHKKMSVTLYKELYINIYK